MLERHLRELEEEELARFRDGVGLDEPHTELVRRAKAVGAAEVYRYLLTMSEDDLNDESNDGKTG
jgi:hypothetical protein